MTNTIATNATNATNITYATNTAGTAQIDNLQDNSSADTIAQAAQEPEKGQIAQSAGESTPEDTQDATKAVIDQQNATIAVLLERTQSLTDQINELIRNGAVINDSNTDPQPQQQQTSLTENYVPLKDLGAEFGKR